MVRKTSESLADHFFKSCALHRKMMGIVLRRGAQRGRGRFGNGDKSLQPSFCPRGGAYVKGAEVNTSAPLTYIFEKEYILLICGSFRSGS